VLPPSSGSKSKSSEEETKPLYLLRNVIYTGLYCYELEITMSWETTGSVSHRIWVGKSLQNFQFDDYEAARKVILRWMPGRYVVTIGVSISCSGSYPVASCGISGIVFVT
jgi:hypothetical protein